VLITFQLLRNGAPYDSTYGWVGNLAMVVPTAACFACAWLDRPRRAPAIWLGLGLLSQTAGNVLISTWLQFEAHPSVPSPADLSYFGFYVCVAAAIVCLVPRDQGSFPRALWLDGALGAAGAATALAAALSPVLSATQGDLATVLVGATYTTADLLLVAMIAGLLAVRGVRGGSGWLWMGGRPRTVLCGRRRLRAAHHRRHVRARDLAVPLVDGRSLVHRVRDLAATAAARH
jgi:hypothetical protein